jgi:AAA family ATP:ADP antiporter
MHSGMARPPDDSNPRGPRRGGPLRAVFDIRREELPLALLMFGQFFLVITSFWILKPLKKGLFLEHYDATAFQFFSWAMTGPQAELLAKVLNMFVAIVAVTVFTALSNRLRRQWLSLTFTAFFLAAYLAYVPIIGAAGDLTVWSFYLFGDLFSTLMVATFFAFLNDSVTSDKAKRLYGLVGLGGVTGGFFGSTIVRAGISRLDADDWLFVCFGIGIVIAALALAAGRIVDRDPPPEAAPAPDAGPALEPGNPAFEGARLVFRSPYLLSIVAIVGLYEIVSTVMDFQFSSAVVHYLDGPAIGKQFSTVFLITNSTAMLVQLFLTSFVMTRLGVGVALLVLPFAALGGSALFMVFPLLWFGSFLNTADNAFSYSINQSAKETLYVPTTRDEKYKAKAFIDMFVQRFAKALAVGVSLAFSVWFTDFESIRWLSIFTIAVIGVWLVAARYAGRYFARIEQS